MKITTNGGASLYVRATDVLTVFVTTNGDGIVATRELRDEGVNDEYRVSAAEARRIIAACGLDDDPGETPEPQALKIEVMTWYDVASPQRNDLVAIITHHAPRGPWVATVVRPDGRWWNAMNFDGDGRGMDGYRILGPHVGPLPWETLT